MDESEQLFQESFRLGCASGQLDALRWYAIQRFEGLLEQGRLSDLEPELIDIMAQDHATPHLRAQLGLLHCEMGRHGDGRAILEDLGRSEFQGLPVDLFWLRAVTLCATIASRLEATDFAHVLYDLLTPYPEQASMVAGVFSGSVSHYMGMLAGTQGRWDEAEVHFAAAVNFHRRASAPAWLARTYLEWARFLLARGKPPDPSQARKLLGSALAVARELNLAGLERTIATLASGDDHRKLPRLDH
jgi:hypothetical protein